jgi:hypothetical protein
MASKQVTSLDDLLSKQLSKKTHVVNLRRRRRARRILAAPRDAGIMVGRASVDVYKAEIAKIK